MSVETLAVDGYVVHRANHTYVERMSFGSPEPRSVRSPRPRGHGAIDTTSLYGPRILSLSGWCGADTAAAALAAWDTLKAVLSVESAHVLVFRRNGRGEDETVTVRVGGALEADEGIGAPKVTWNVVLVAEDPRLYAVTVQADEQRPVPSTSIGELTVVNGGTFPTPPTIMIYGPTGTDPTNNTPWVGINNLTTGKTLRLGVGINASFSLQAGETAIVDMAARTFTLDATGIGGGVVELPQVVDPVLSDWWELAPGSNDLSLDGHVLDGETGWRVEWRDARI